MTTSLIKILILPILLLVFVVSSLVRAQDNWSPPGFQLTPEEIGVGFELREQYEFLKRESPDGPEGRFLVQDFVQVDPDASNGEVHVQAMLGVFPSEQHLIQAWEALREDSLSNSQIADSLRVGDVCQGLYPTHLKVLSGHALFRLVIINQNPTFTEENQSQLLHELAVVLQTKIQDSGVPPLTPFSPEFIVTSEKPLMVEVSANQEFGLAVGYGVLNTDTDEYIPVQEVTNFTGQSHTVTVPEGLSNGRYLLQVTVFDGLLRQASYDKPFEVASLSSPFEVSAIKDSTLTQKHPHQNEGANPLLTLEKIQGKAARCAVAFDLANENVNGLTKATLVFKIDPASHVTGWGNGETVSAQALSADWLEGNGKSFGFKKKDAVAGSGSGTTWFSPIDENISNDFANSVSQWNGGQNATTPATAPPVIVTNHTSGTLEFDVTSDVLNGADSWLILRDQENRGSQISFFSKESGPDLAPKLILDFGDQVASNTSNSTSLLGRLGFGSHNLKLKAEPRGSELLSLREILQQNPTLAWTGQGLIGLASGPNPVLNHASQNAYRVWLMQGVG